MEDSCNDRAYAEEGVARGEFARGSIYTPVAGVWTGAAAGDYEGTWTSGGEPQAECYRFAVAYAFVYGLEPVGVTSVDASRWSQC